MKYELIATSPFGIEAVLKREIEALGCRILSSEDGRISYIGNEETIVRSNLHLRTADRVYIKMGSFAAETFEDVFQGVSAVAWEEYIPIDGNILVEAISVKSKLFAVPSIQSVAEKALIARLSSAYGLGKNAKLSKSGAKYRLRVGLLKDACTLMLDTSGAGLHKRGYRTRNVAAPIKETLAAAMVQLSYWKAGRLLVDPFCGSGTIPIEAALIAKNIAPGLGRSFVSEDWPIIPPEIWKRVRAEAFHAIDHDAAPQINGFDKDLAALEAARENALNAGVEEAILFKRRDFTDDSQPPLEAYSIIITNPPYGERIGDQQAIRQIYARIRECMAADDTLSLYLITSDRDFEKNALGRSADRRRKLYNGRLQTTYYQYYGKRPETK